MVEEHTIFKKPHDENVKIWRYLDFTKFIDLINSQSLFFCRADLFDDKFEGSVPKNTATLRDNQFYETIVKKSNANSRYTVDYLQERGKKDRQNIALNCWHVNNLESAAMWNLYLKSNEGIAIQSTYKKLRNCLIESNLSIQIGMVNYIDYDKDIIGWNNGFIPYIHKRKSFEHEKELRALIWSLADVNVKNNVNFSKGGISVPIDVKDLFEKIYVSPNSSLWYTNLVKDLIKKYNIEVEVVNSNLNNTPIY